MNINLQGSYDPVTGLPVPSAISAGETIGGVIGGLLSGSGLTLNPQPGTIVAVPVIRPGPSPIVLLSGVILIGAILYFALEK